jgi:RNA polymerase sigma factor (sigma-70 family)
MVRPDSFGDWFGRVKAGDQTAAAELAVSLAPILRKVVRARLSHLRLSGLVDPLDVCQAVFGSFFARAAEGRLAVKSAEQLRALLVTIALNKCRDEARRHTAGRRDHRRVVHCRTNDQLGRLASREQAPVTLVSQHELLERALRQLSAEERVLLEERIMGRNWAVIAAARGVPARVLRQRLSRALHRVRRRLGGERALPVGSAAGAPPRLPHAALSPQ